jgi:hypothetical protein
MDSMDDYAERCEYVYILLTASGRWKQNQTEQKHEQTYSQRTVDHSCGQFLF